MASTQVNPGSPTGAKATFCGRAKSKRQKIWTSCAAKCWLSAYESFSSFWTQGNEPLSSSLFESTLESSGETDRAVAATWEEYAANRGCLSRIKNDRKHPTIKSFFQQTNLWQVWQNKTKSTKNQAKYDCTDSHCWTNTIMNSFQKSAKSYH